MTSDESQGHMSLCKKLRGLKMREGGYPAYIRATLSCLAFAETRPPIAVRKC